jgi:hypothetical protein
MAEEPHDEGPPARHRGEHQEQAQQEDSAPDLHLRQSVEGDGEDDSREAESLQDPDEERRQLPDPAHVV